MESDATHRQRRASFRNDKTWLYERKKERWKKKLGEKNKKILDGRGKKKGTSNLIRRMKRNNREGRSIETRSRRYLGIFRCNYGLIRFTTNLLNRDRSRIHESYSEQKRRTQRDKDKERRREGEKGWRMERRREPVRM